MKKYYDEVSGGKMNLSTLFVSETNNSTVCTVTIDEARSAYLPKYFNDEGETGFEGAYDNKKYNGKQHIDRFIVEQLLIRKVLNKLDFTPLAGYDLDADDDGEVDNISFMFAGDVYFNNYADNIWGEVLWPHMTSMQSFSASTTYSEYYVPNDFSLTSRYSSYGISQIDTEKKYSINGAEIYNYNVLSSTHLFETGTNKSNPVNVGVLCHEYAHSMGYLDYYSYEEEEQAAKYLSVGIFDLMASTTANPQYMTTYLRQKAGWVTDDEIISPTKDGDYTLTPTSANGNVKALKIVLDGYETEYFMIEARSSLTGTFDTMIDGTGLIIYRINTAAEDGNMTGDDEVYVFRNGNSPTSVSLIKSGFLEKSGSFGSIVEDAVPSSNTIFYQGTNNELYKEKNSKIALTKIKVNSDNTVSFHLDIPTKEATDIEIISDKTECYLGYFNIEDYKIRINYNDNTFEEVDLTEDMIANEELLKLNTLGEKTLEVAYEGILTQLEVTVKAVEYSEMIIYDIPDTIYEGMFSSSDITLRLTVKNGEYEYTPLTDEMISESDLIILNTAGTHAVQVTFNGLSTTLNVTVLSSEIIITSIKVKTEITEIYINEFNLSDYSLLITYSDDSTNIIEIKTNMLPDDYLQILSEKGEKRILVSYGGKSDEIVLTVKEKEEKTVKTIDCSIGGGTGIIKFILGLAVAATILIKRR